MADSSKASHPTFRRGCSGELELLVQWCHMGHKSPEQSLLSVPLVARLVVKSNTSLSFVWSNFFGWNCFILIRSLRVQENCWYNWRTTPSKYSARFKCQQSCCRYKNYLSRSGLNCWCHLSFASHLNPGLDLARRVVVVCGAAKGCAVDAWQTSGLWNCCRVNKDGPVARNGGTGQ